MTDILLDRNVGVSLEPRCGHRHGMTSSATGGKLFSLMGRDPKAVRGAAMGKQAVYTKHRQFGRQLPRSVRGGICGGQC